VGELERKKADAKRKKELRISYESKKEMLAPNDSKRCELAEGSRW
jgi:hypothetical protein